MNGINPISNIGIGQIGPIKQTNDGVFTAEGVAPTGERIYFAMESLGDDKEKWDEYRNEAGYLVTGGNSYLGTIGNLIELGSRINDEIDLKEFISTRTYPDYWTCDQQRFDQLKNKLRERKIVVDSPKAKELKLIPHASNGVNVRMQTHMVYVSKSPISGRAKLISSSSNQGFGAYVDRYGDLVMSVGVTIKDLVENRGIFRNPLSVVQGGYGGIAMMAHSFTCMVVQENWPLVKSFKVRPLKVMGEIFMNSVPKKLFTVNGIPADQYDKGFDHEQDILAPVEVLADLHRVK